MNAEARIPLGTDGQALRLPDDAVEGAIDYFGRPASRFSSGRWRSAVFIIGVEIAERSAQHGISINLISYLTGPLGESTAAAAAAVNLWAGVSYMLPLVGALVADSYLGRYRTVVVASLLYLLPNSLFYGIIINLISYDGPLGEPTVAAEVALNLWTGVSYMLPLVGVLVADSYLSKYRTVVVASLLYLLNVTLSSALPSLRPTQCIGATSSSLCDPPKLQAAIFFFSLYLVGLAQSGHRPCVQAFGADQFDETDPEERKSLGTFFNWWLFGVYVGATVTGLCLNYVQDNVSWVLGFGIPCILMVIAIVIFLLGSRTYRYYGLENTSKISNVFIEVVKQWKRPPNTSAGNEASESLLLHAPDCNEISDQEKCSQDGCSVEAKGWLQLLSVWATCLVFAVVIAQSATFFTKQGSTLDRRIWSKFQVPPASLRGCIGITVVAVVPIYDRVVVPVASRITGKPNGITLLQRIGIGMMLSLIVSVVAALVEMMRLRTARESGLVDLPMAVIPMSICWLIPQYILLGLTDVFIMVGLQEFFYSQVPDAFRSFGLALYLSIFGFGELISSLLVWVINYITERRGQSWFSENLNRAHLDYFYWLLAGLSAVGFAIYLHFAQSYVYKKKANLAA